MTIKDISVIIIAFAIGAIIGKFLFENDVPKSRFRKTETLIIRDTVTKVLPGKKIYIKAKPEIIYRDTLLIKAKPFEAVIDTAHLRDSISASYLFPENLFSIKIKSLPDSVDFEKIIFKQNLNTGFSGWEAAGIGTAGTLIGVVIGFAINK